MGPKAVVPVSSRPALLVDSKDPASFPGRSFYPPVLEVSWKEQGRHRFSGIRQAGEEGVPRRAGSVSREDGTKEEGGGGCHAERDLTPSTQDSFIGERM